MNQHQAPQPPSQQDPTRIMGKTMMYIGWLILLGLLTWLFTGYEQKKLNPNQQLMTSSADGFNEVILKRNAYGHYVSSGTINGVPVTFLLDTGATHVSVPEKMGESLSLTPMARARTSTANGFIDVFVTRIDELRLGNIVANDVRANLNPGMNHSDSILLGMSVLKHVEFTQQGDVLILRQSK
jgi:aspartyl protease family protein